MHGYVLADGAWLVTGNLGTLAAAWHPPALAAACRYFGG
jgi:hypothetical protein